MVMCKTDSARLSMSRLDLSGRLVKATYQGDLSGSSCQGETVDLEPLSRYKHPLSRYKHPFLGDPPPPRPSPNPGLIRHVSGQSRLGKQPCIIHDTP